MCISKIAVGKIVASLALSFTLFASMVEVRSASAATVPGMRDTTDCGAVPEMMF